jgi:hypothetical protein
MRKRDILYRIAPREELRVNHGADMTLFSLSPNANSNFPDSYRRRLRGIAPLEHASPLARATMERQPAADRQDAGEKPPGTASPAGGRVYASKFKADLTNLMAATPWEADVEPDRSQPPREPKAEQPLAEFVSKDEFLGHFATLLAAAKSGDAAVAKTAAASLQANALDEAGGPMPSSPSDLGDTVQSLIDAARAGEIDASRAAARNLARDLRGVLAAQLRALRERDGAVAAGAAYETLMEFTQAVATAA